MHKINNKTIFLILIMIVVSFVATNVIIGSIYNNSREKPIDLGDYSTVDIITDEGVRKTVDIDGYLLEHKGDTALITINLPISMREDSYCIEMTTLHCTVDAYYENNLIYSAGHEYAWENKMIGSISPCIEVPNDAWGKSIVVKLVSQEPVTIGIENNIQLYKLIDNQQYFNGGFLMGFYHYIVIIFISFVVMLLTILNYKNSRVMRQVFWIAAFTFAISAWGISNYGYYNLIFRNSWAWAQVEYASIFFAPAFLAIYAIISGKNKLMQTYYGIIAILMTVLAVVSTVLNFTSEIHYVQLLPLNHVLIVLGGVPFAASIIRDLRNMNYQIRIFNYGFLMMLILGLVEVLKINLLKSGLVETPREIAIMPIGMAVFVGTILIFSIMMIINYLEYDVERKNLLTMAYEDPMTEMANRAGCDMRLKRLQSMPSVGYSIVYMDLNKLKYVNDNFGHDAGDVYIRNFAISMKSVFGGKGFCGRIGGDEFIVILENKIVKDTKLLVEEFKEEISELNESGKFSFDISVAVGYAVSHQNDNKDVMDVLKVADQRMYEDKSLVE